MKLPDNFIIECPLNIAYINANNWKQYEMDNKRKTQN